MIFGTPISWFMNEIIGFILIMICVAHAVKQKEPYQKILELVFYMLTAGIFENIGVFGNIYYYSMDRIMMFGKVPFSILFIEGAILYSTVVFLEHLKVPKWVLPFGVGLLSSVQDMTLDPASVFDLHTINGVLEGQWNWTTHYEGGFVNIPFFNFSGWFTMMLYYMAAIQIGRFLYKKYHKKWIGVTYPIAAMLFTLILQVSPVNQILLFGVPFAEIYTKHAELIMLVINFSLSFFLLIRYAKYDLPIKRQDAIMITIPVFLHVYALINSVIMGIHVAILPIIIVSIIHIAYLFVVTRKCQKENYNY